MIDCNNDVYDDKEDYELTRKWMKLRTDDMSFVVDTIIKNAKYNGSGQVYQLIDTNKIGLMGHSLGGSASAQVARERDDIDAVIYVIETMNSIVLKFLDSYLKGKGSFDSAGKY